MPGQVKTPRRSCKDMSEAIQETINFPQRRSTRAASSSAVARKTYSLRSPAVVDGKKKDNENVNSVEVEKTVPVKKRVRATSNKDNKDENRGCTSPTKSPRKETLTRCKSPLSDRTNSQCGNQKVSSVTSEAESTPTKETSKTSNRDKALAKSAEKTAKEPSEIVEETGTDSHALAKENVYSKVCRVLHNSIPKQLVGREHELHVLKEFVAASVVASNPGSLYICGAPGTGKTACLTKVLDECKNLKAKVVFLNCMSLRTSQSIFSKLASLVDSKTMGCSNQEGIKYFEKKIITKGQKILVVLDEIDQLESKDQEVLYKLFEMPFIPKSRLVLIGIANSLDFTDRILPRLQTKAWCKPTLLQFQPYSKNEICAILQGRITETDNDVVDQSAVQFCARKVSAMTGDARKALDILRRAVEIADGDSKKQGALEQEDSENLTKVTIGHVAKVCSDVYSTRLAPSNNVRTVFPLQQKVIICTLLSCLKKSQVKEIALSKLYGSYSRVCSSRLIPPLGQEEFNGICDLLDSQGIVGTKKAKDVKNNKLTLRVQESELEHSLQDKSLMVSILSSEVC